MNPNKFLYTFFFLHLILSNDTFAGGIDVGNGGSGYSVEFASMAQNLFDHWDELNFSDNLQVTRDEYKLALKSVKIYFVSEPIYVNGFEVDAKNYPSCSLISQGNTRLSTKYCGAIEVNMSRWDNLGKSKIRQFALIIHEYLGVLQKNNQRFDDFYEISGKVFEKLKKILQEQKRIEVNFVCELEVWSHLQNKKELLVSLDTYNSALPREFIAVKTIGQPYDLWIEIYKVDGSWIAPMVINELRFTLYKSHPMMIPNQSDILHNDIIRFGQQGKASLRIWNQPELQLTCFRTFDHIQEEK